LTSWIDTRDAAEFVRENPQANIGNPGLPGNKNHYIHTAREAWPFQGAPLAAWVLRLFSLGLGALTLTLTYTTARLIFLDSRVALLAAALMAFNPQFVYLSASINNDNGMNVLAAGSLYVLARLWRGDRSWRAILALGLLLGAATLTKLTGLILLGLAAVVIGYLAVTRRAWRWALRIGLVVGLSVIAIGGWWYLRNWQLYGEPTGADMLIKVLGQRAPITLATVILELPSLWFSSWGVFGWFNLQSIDAAFAVYTAIVLAALCGGVLAWRRHGWSMRRAEPLWALGLWAALVLAGVLRWETVAPAFQGRLLFPALGALAILLAAGLSELFGRWRVATGALAIGMLAIAIDVPLGVIAPGYRLPDRIQLADVPSNVQRLNVDFNGTLRLIGGRVETPAQPGAVMSVVLYWQALRRPDREYMVFVHVLGRKMELVGNADAYHGQGTFPTDLWRGDEMIVDHFSLRLSEQASVPARVRVEVGLRDRTTQQPVTVTNADGSPRADLVVVDQFRLEATGPIAQPQVPAQYRLGEAIELLGYEPPTLERGTLTYRLHWQVLKQPAEDFTVFAHLLDANGRLIGQGDSQPFDGDYPTSWWRAGETFVEERTLPLTTGSLPAGAKLGIGLYRLADGSRLPVIDAAGQAMPDGQIMMQDAGGKMQDGG
jgi:4-amino-4-deoxy-L-arabinose transferase-like glycosyltransferase